jgi:hypothetical protein
MATPGATEEAKSTMNSIQNPLLDLEKQGVIKD